MKVLAVDTATEVLALAATDGSASVSLALRRGLAHSPVLLPMASRLLSMLGLEPRDLELLVCSLGPGSFTGIRIGLASVKGIACATGCPVAGVSTLDALALPWALSEADVWPVVDARKGNWYAARYRGGERASDFMDASPARLQAAIEQAASTADGTLRAILVGPDASRASALAFGEKRPGWLATSDLYDPVSLLRAGLERYRRSGPGTPDGLTPLYLRRSEAELAGDAALKEIR